MRRNFRLASLAVLFAGFVTGAAAHGQGTNSGDIRGTVTDSTGALLPGVTVTIVNRDTGVTKVLTTNKDGLYDTSSIVVGNYSVTFQKQDFERFERSKVTLEVGTSTVNASLKIGSTAEEVVVNTDIPLLKTESGEQSTVLTSKTMAQLPQVGEDWEHFIILLPGSAGAATATQSDGGVSAADPGQIASVNGNLPFSNILADGASTTLSMSQNANPAVFETVGELQVQTSSFSAQYGIGGILINQITKGGTSTWHGAAYDYLQNRALDSYPYEFGAGASSIPAKPALHYNNFGGNIGGPIDLPLWNLKHKAFFFFNYDQIINHGGSSTATQTVPTTAVLGGDFTGQRTLYDPTTQTIAYDINGNPYPVRQSFLSEYGSNAIPAAMWDTVSANFQKFYPTPSSHIPGGEFIPGSLNSSGLLQNNWVSQVPSSSPFRRYFGRLDYDITPSNRLTMSDTQSDTPVVAVSNVTACPIGCQSQDVDNNNAQVTDVWTLGARTTNEARLGYTWQASIFGDEALGKGYQQQLGWTWGKADDFPAMQFINTYPYAWIEPSTNAVYKEHVFDPSDVVTMIRGKHVLHFGGEFLLYRDDATAWGNTNAGTYQFSGQFTQDWTLNSQGVAVPDSNSGLEYADMLLGLAQNWSARVAPEWGGRFKTPQIFVQDDWKLKPNLTLNLGLRYQINHGWTDVHGNAATFDPTVMNPATQTLGAFWYESTHANGRTAIEANVYNTILPRFGFSWLMKPQTTIRGGVGLYSYELSIDNYAGGAIGALIQSTGNAADQTNGVTPPIKVDSPNGSTNATPLPYTAASTDPARYNGQSVNYTPYNTPVAKIIQWNLSTQHMVGNNLVVELSYVASHGYNLTYSTNLNQIPLDHLSSNDTAFRPYPQYTSIGGNRYDAISNYNSLQVSVTKRTTHGLSFNFNYVWSHFLDDQDSSGWGSRNGPTPYVNGFDPSSNYANSNFDVRNAFKGYVVYELPFGRGRRFLNNNPFVDAVIGGWQLSDSLVLSSGNPFNIYGTQNTYGGYGSAFPNWTGANPYPAHKTYTTWFNESAFTVPADGTEGNFRRNQLYGPGTEVTNISLSKTFSLVEHTQLMIRADAYNAFNHPSFGEPGQSGQTLGFCSTCSAAVGANYSGTGQQITTLQVGNRNIQLGARLSF